MSVYCLNTGGSLTVAYSTVASLTGYASPSLLGQAIYKALATSAAWVSQGPAPTTFAYTGSNNAFTATAHNFRTGMPVQVSTTVTLPTGLVAATTYWVIVVDVNTFKLASSYANATAGTAVAISGAGSGVQTADTVAVKNGPGSTYLAAGVAVDVDGALGAKLSVIQDSAAGELILTPAIPSR